MKIGDRVKVVRMACDATHSSDVGKTAHIAKAHDGCLDAKCWWLRELFTCFREDELEVISPELKVGDWAEHDWRSGGSSCPGCQGRITKIGQFVHRSNCTGARTCHVGKLSPPECTARASSLKPCPAPTGNRTIRDIIDDYAREGDDKIDWSVEYAEAKAPQSANERTCSMDGKRTVDFELWLKAKDAEGKLTTDKMLMPDTNAPRPRLIVPADWTREQIEKQILHESHELLVDKVQGGLTINDIVVRLPFGPQ